MDDQRVEGLAAAAAADPGEPSANMDTDTGNLGGIDLVTRALRHQGLWLTLTYVGLILLMARVYA